jgi:hypothetical protein
MERTSDGDYFFTAWFHSYWEKAIEEKKGNFSEGYELTLLM